MGRLKECILSGTTNGSGAATVNGTEAIFGKLYAVEWVDGTLSDGGSATITAQNTASGVARTLLTLANPLINADAWYYPRHATHDEAGAGITYDGTREVHDLPVINGVPRVAVTSGGATKTFSCILYYYE